MDENGNAARVQFHGLGLRGDMQRDAPAALRAKINLLLTDTRYVEKVARMRDAFLRDAQVQNFESLVDEHSTASCKAAS